MPTPIDRPFENPAAWTGREIAGLTDWVHTLTPAEVEDALRIAAAVARRTRLRGWGRTDPARDHAGERALTGKGHAGSPSLDARAFRGALDGGDGGAPETAFGA